MHLCFLGTGAADFSKELKTIYADCFDEHVRRSCALLVDDRILIDCGPHTVHALALAGKKPAQLTHLLITHTHSDHFVPQEIAQLLQAAGHPVCVVGGPEALDALRQTALPDGTVLQPAVFGQPLPLDGGCTATPLYANHLTEHPEERALHYLLEQNGKRMFYACDGAWMITQTAKFLKNAALDALIIDCTVGDYDGDFRIFEHNSLPMLRMMESGMRTLGILAPNSRVILSHLARTLHKPHAETAALAAKNHYEVARDGMETDI